MTRRQFLKWLFAALGATGMGVVIGRNFRTICPVTLVNVPDYSRDFSKDVAKVLLEDGMIIKGKKVLLKPNFVEFHPGRPINTDIAFIRNIAEACLSLGAADVVVAVNGKYGTLSEISFALIEKKLVLGLNTWPIKGIKKLSSPKQVINYIKNYLC